MEKSQRSVVRRAITPANAGRPLSPPLSASAMYYCESASQMQAVSEQRLDGFTYARDGHPNATALAEKISWMEAAQKAGALLLVDNTFTTPSGFNPLAHGAHRRNSQNHGVQRQPL